MMTRRIDCRGLNCPQPVINTKKALEQLQSGSVETIVDNETARQNVTLFAQNAGYTVEEREENGLFYITVTRGEGAGQEQADKRPPEPETGSRPVYLVSTNSFGQGSPDLGAVLIKSLMNTLVESEPVPAALIFLNTGVYLACEGSEVISHLRQLSAAGTEIIACGTCLDYYQLREKLAVGTVSNMFEINSKLTGPNQVITIA